MSESENIEEVVKVNNIKSTLTRIGEIVENDFSEDEVQMVFLNEGYFNHLGYSDIGSDLQSEVSIEGTLADYVTTGQRFGTSGAVTTVYEFKNPTKQLKPHEDQLQGYVTGISASYGVLTNGQNFILYQRNPNEIKEIVSFDIKETTGAEAGIIVQRLSSLSVEERELRTMAKATAEVVADELPRKLWAHPGFSGPVIDTFAEYHAEFLLDELSNRR